MGHDFSNAMLGFKMFVEMTIQSFKDNPIAAKTTVIALIVVAVLTFLSRKR